MQMPRNIQQHYEKLGVKGKKRYNPCLYWAVAVPSIDTYSKVYAYRGHHVIYLEVACHIGQQLGGFLGLSP